MEHITHTSGRFGWHDVFTSDVQATLKFYSDIFGFTSQKKDENYTYLLHKGKEFAGIVNKSGTQWVPYVLVSNIENVTKAASEKGGKITSAVAAFDKVGKFASFTDPQGGSISLWERVKTDSKADTKVVTTESKDHHPLKKGPTHEEFDPIVWHQLETTDRQPAITFYKTVLGWRETTLGLGSDNPQTTFRAEGEMMPQAAVVVGKQSCWTSFFGVDKCETYAKKATEMKAKQIMAPTSVGERTVAVFADPQGAVFGIMSDNVTA
jgi:predicted enzyme related to lactoylglutathione lyase